MRDAALEELGRPEPPPSMSDLLAVVRSAWARLPAWAASLALVSLAVAALVSWQLLRNGPDVADSLPRAEATVTTVLLDPARAGAGSPAGEPGSPVVVHVAGAVMRPGVVELPAGSRAVDAVTAAGGLGPEADADRVNLAAPLVDGERLAIPLVGQPAPVEIPPELPTGGTDGGGGTGTASAAPLDINTASAEALDALPGVGPATASAIVAHRSSSGPFRSVEQLLDVRGIGEAKLEGLRDLVTVRG